MGGMEAATTTATMIDEMLELVSDDADTAAFIRPVLEALTPDELAETFANVQAEQAEKDDLRARLIADADLRLVVCPHTSWGTSFDRFKVAQGALNILEGQAAHHDLTTEELVAAITANGDSIRQTIEAFGDPRRDRVYGSRTAFYAWRCRVSDGVVTATADARREAAARKRQQDEARWEKLGLTRCDRCGGAGGHDGWPGFTCYGCGGEGATA